LKTFKGGTHPPGYKEATADRPISDIPLPSEVVIPLTQHIGAPNKSLVAKGDQVEAGQKIGQAEAFVSAPVHASVSGTVKAVEPRPHFLGTKMLSVVIEVAEEQKETKMEIPDGEPEADDIRKLVKEAGLVGLGGAAFPTHVKLSPPKEKPIGTVIINGCECESFLTCDYRQMLEQAHDLIDGTTLIMKTLGAENAFIAIEDNKPEAIKHLQKQVAALPKVQVASLPTKYPEGAEKMLIDVVLDREVPSGGLPMDVGALVQNVGTTIVLSKAVRQGSPLTERVITVSGSAIGEPKNLRVKIGTPVEHIINNCGGFSKEPAKIVVGGPMTGFAQFDLSVPIVKGTSGILALSTDEISLEPLNQTACIRCARCIDHCPVHLMPNYYAVYGDLGDWEAMESFNVMDCVECGACSFVCPARIPHVQYIRLGKARVLAKAKAKK